MSCLVKHLFLVLASVAALAAQTVSPSDEAARLAFAELETVARSARTVLSEPAARAMPRAERERISAASGELTVALGEKFLRNFPDDARRWEAIALMLGSRRVFDGADAESRTAVWRARVRELFQRVAGDPGVPAETIAKVAAAEFYSVVLSERTPDLDRARVAVELMAARVPEWPGRASAERSYLEKLHPVDPAAALERGRTLLAGPNGPVAEAARLWLCSVEFKTKPLDLKFPDLDGREIDLARYRGKVVLLDFWATWCAPCMEQMPHLAELYRKYHARGFEVIGVTDDLPPRDPAKPRPVEKTLPLLKEFLVKHSMPWPQLWDLRPRGIGPKGLLQQFGVHSLPTYLLFDRDGMFVTSDVRGEKLEAEVKRLLEP